MGLAAQIVDVVVKVPSPFPRSIEMVPLIPPQIGPRPPNTARSAFPSLLKSATTIPAGANPAGSVELTKVRKDVGPVIVKGTALDVPPPGLGFETVTEAVLAEARLEPGTSATSLSELTNVVASAAPFQLTTDVETNPAPFTVSVTLALPGGAASGASGRLTRGAGFDWDNKNVVARQKNRQTK
jgi:hypothetical protein